MGAFEVEFYTLIEAFPVLKSGFLATCQIELIETCSRELEQLSAISRVRTLTTSEQQAKQRLEEAIAESKERLDDVWPPKTVSRSPNYA